MPRKKARPEIVAHPLGTEVYPTEQAAQVLHLSARHILGAIK